MLDILAVTASEMSLPECMATVLGHLKTLDSAIAVYLLLRSIRRLVFLEEDSRAAVDIGECGGNHDSAEKSERLYSCRDASIG
jgi:hypothetical protein